MRPSLSARHSVKVAARPFCPSPTAMAFLPLSFLRRLATIFLAQACLWCCPAAYTLAADTCASLPQCYCIRRSPCGWCKSKNQAFIEQGKCGAGDWVTDSDQCPTLYCDRDKWSSLRMKLWCFCFPSAMACLWLQTWWWRRSLSLRGMQELEKTDLQSRRITFAAGHSKCIQEDSIMKLDHRAALSEASDFFKVKRSYESFRMGKECPLDARLPQETKRGYTLNVATLMLREEEEQLGNARVPRFRLLMTIKLALQWRAALGANLRFVTFMMLVSATNMACFKLAAQRCDEFMFMRVAFFVKEFGGLAKTLQLAVSVLLSFYTLNRISWYWRMCQAGWDVQGRFHDLGMIIGPALGDKEEDFQKRYVLYRHFMLTFFWTYQPYTPSLHFLGFGPLLDCGLLLPEEVGALEGAHDSPKTVVESWLSRWLQRYIVDVPTRNISLRALCELRDACGTVAALVEERAPVSFESLVYISVCALCFILPFVPGGVDLTNRRAIVQASNFCMTLGHGVLIGFYMSLVHLLYHQAAPFDSIGVPHDCLNPLSILNTTEKKLRDYLVPEPDAVTVDAGPGKSGERSR